MADKLKRFKTYRQEYFRDKRRNNKWRGQVEARLEADQRDCYIQADIKDLDKGVTYNN